MKPKTFTTAKPAMLALAVAFALLVPAAHGQTAPPSDSAKPPTTPANAKAAPAQVPAISVESEEVSLDLVVRKRSKLVLDLAPKDLAVTDDGKPVELTSLRLVKGKQDADRLVTLVFDRMDPSASKNARQIADKILRVVPQTGFSFAVLSVDGRLKLLQQFTENRSAVSDALGAATDPDKLRDAAILPEKQLIAVAQTGTDAVGTAASLKDRARAQTMLATLQESQRIVQDRHDQQALSGLLAIARMQRQFTGRKVVIFFAQALPGGTDTADLIQTVNGAANRSGVSIYAVDANAIDSASMQKMMVAVGMGQVGTFNHLNPQPTGINTPQDPTPGGMVAQGADTVTRFEADSLTGSFNIMAKLAAGTGGAYIPAGDSVKKPLQRLVEDMTTYYEASYVPPTGDYDGRFRPVVIHPLRKGLAIRTRSGYFAMPPSADAGIRPFETPLLKILAEPQLPSDLKFRSTIFRLGDLPDGNANSLVIEVPLAQIEMREDPNTRLYNAHLSIVAQIRNKAGVEIEHFSEDIPRHGALEALPAARAEVVTLQRHFLAPPGQYVLEAAVLDRNSETAGAQRIEFEIPKPSDGPALSDIALVRRTDALAPDADPLEPLRYKNGRVVPNLSGVVPHDAREISLFFMIHPDSHATEPPTLEMEVAKNGATVGRMPLQLRQGSGQSAVPYMGSIQAKSFSPGKYEVTATITQGARISEQSIAFTIDGPELASASGNASVPPPSASSAADLAPPTNIPGVSSREAPRLVITSPSNPVAPPSAEEIQAVLDGARDRALRYGDSLPNFSCVELTNRSVDHAGTGRWKHRDSIAQLLRYVDHAETKLTLAVNGVRSDKPQADLKGASSNGEFGGVLNAVFSPKSKADFHWKETDNLGAGMVQVFDYSVAEANSSFGLTGDANWQLTVGFHGQVYIDSATRSVRRVTLVADNTPKNFSIHSSTITIDYDYVSINEHDYLMPARGSMSLRQGKHEAVLNEIEFRDYKRFGSKTRILGFTPTTNEN